MIEIGPNLREAMIVVAFVLLMAVMAWRMR